MKLYGISGLGADKRVFQYLSLKHEIIPVDWISPLKNETISNYVCRLLSQINTSEKFGLIGVSFGGLVATELNKIIKPEITILISSIANKHESKWLYRFIGSTQIINIIPHVCFNMPIPVANWLFGAKNKVLLKEIITDTDSKFVKWALQQFANWQHNDGTKNLLKINGTNDKLIKTPNNVSSILIKDGGHFMVVDNAEEISAIINKQFSKNL
jgi:hypothetical protein